MRGIKIVVDSCCDLPKALLEKFDIKMVPANINIGKRSYEDGVEMKKTCTAR